MKVVIVGAGVIGASIAYQLARQGADVLVVDAGVTAASQTSFGWINASFYADPAHHALRVESMAAYGRLMAELPELPVRNTGALWFEAQGAALRQMQCDLEALGYPVQKLARSQVGETAVQGLPEEMLRFPSESAAEAGALASDLMAASGAQLVSGCRVTGIVTHDGAVTAVASNMGEIPADQVIVAAGNGAPDILASVGVELPMLTRPGVLVTTKPVEKTIGSILVTPHGEVRQLPDGRVLASAVANHQGDDASEVTETPQAIGARVLGWLRELINAPLDLDRVGLAYRPVPQDGLPVIGAVGPKGLHVAVMHSGVTLAGVTGEVIAAMVMKKASTAQMAMLAPYRADRFSAG